MKTIRTTVTLPEDVYDMIRIKAAQEQKTFGEIIIDFVKQKNVDSIQKRVEQDFAFFQKLARKSPKIDMVKALREDRDRDNA